MNLWNWLRSRRIRFRERHNRESELDREMEAHLELEAEEQEESGLQPDEAHFAARRAFGNTAIVREDVRAVWNSRRPIKTWRRNWEQCENSSHVI